jgi:hypothetical protein
MKRYEALPERVHVYSDAYGERLGFGVGPLPEGPRLLGEESEYVRADLHRGAVSLNELRAIAQDMYVGMRIGSPEQLAVSEFLGHAESLRGQSR